MWIVKNRKLFFALSAALVVLSLLLVAVRGLNIGIDFTGGTAFEITYSGAEEQPELDEVKSSLQEVGLDQVAVRPFGDTAYMFQMQGTSTELHNTIYEAVTGLDPIATTTINATTAPAMSTPNFIGPSIGAELRSKAWIAIATVIIGIIFFVAYAFRHGSEKISSWKFGIVAVIALAHDIIIPTGVAAFVGVEVGTLFVIALLAILGLSVNDTIVVFDRVRENIKLKVSRSFEELVGKSLQQTFIRSINTSITTLFVVLALFFFGPSSVRDFALILAVGLAVGTYSSIFLASPLLVEAEKIQRKQEQKEKQRQEEEENKTN